MKKLAVLLAGMSLALGSLTFAFGQDGKMKDKQKPPTKKGAKKNGTDKKE